MYCGLFGGAHVYFSTFEVFLYDRYKHLCVRAVGVHTGDMLLSVIISVRRPDIDAQMSKAGVFFVVHHINEALFSLQNLHI